MVTRCEKIEVGQVFDIAPYVISSLCHEIAQEQDDDSKIQLDEEKLIYELTVSLLGSLSKHEHTVHFSNLIKEKLISTGEYKTIDRIELTERILKLLSPIDGSLKCRFSKSRSQNIANAIHYIFVNYGSVKNMIGTYDCESKLRAFLVKEIKGIGPKQASFFIRNIGYSDSIAILDSHIVFFLNAIKLLDSPKPNLSCISTYQKLESNFKSYSQEMGYSVGIVDQAVWIFTRVLKREFLH